MAKPVKKTVAPVAVIEAPPVTEVELREVQKLRRDIADLNATKNATQKRLDIIEANLIKRLRTGAKVEGKLVAIVEMVKGRIAVSWKDVAMRLAVKCGLNPVEVELEEKKAKEATLVAEPTLLITGDAVEQYVGNAVGK